VRSDDERRIFEKEWGQRKKALRGYIASKICPGCPRKGQDIVGDLVQEVAACAWKSWDPEKELSWSYLRKVADSVVTDCYRKRDCQAAESLEELAAAREPATPKEATERAALRSIEFWRLLELLSNHGGLSQEVVCFLYVKLLEWKPAEVEELAGRPVKELLQEGLVEYATVFDNPASVRKKLKGFFTSMLKTAPTDPLGQVLESVPGAVPVAPKDRPVDRAVENVRRRLIRNW